jgi:hypothetical protein
MVGILGSLDRIPKMMGDEFQQKALRRRPGQGRTGGEFAPDLEITKVGGERPERVVAHALLSQMLEGRDILVG